MADVQTNATTNTPRNITRAGYVYVLESENKEYYKIGKTKVLAVRVIKQLKVQLPFAVNVAYAFATDDRSRDETKLHRHFRSKRLNGEWFALNEDDLLHIRAFCNYRGCSIGVDGVMRPDPLMEARG